MKPGLTPVMLLICDDMELTSRPHALFHVHSRRRRFRSLTTLRAPCYTPNMARENPARTALPMIRLTLPMSSLRVGERLVVKRSGFNAQAHPGQPRPPTPSLEAQKNQR